MQKPLLVLDLDETLWRGRHTLQGQQFSMRPHLQTFLHEVSRHHDLGVWTAAKTHWMLDGLQVLQAQTGFDLAHHAVFVWDREECTLTRAPDGLGSWRKSPRKFHTSGLSRQYRRIRVLDDQQSHWAKTPRLHLPITPWTGNPDDQELLRVAQQLNREAQQVTALAPSLGAFSLGRLLGI